VSQLPAPGDPVPHHRQVLFEALGISVVDFRCHSQVEPEGPEEPNPTHSIVFVRRGVFRRTRERETVVADPNHVLFFNAAQPYRYSHPLPGGDECTILAVETNRALELVARHAPRDAENPEAPFRLGHGLSPLRVARLHYELLALIHRRGSALVLEDVLSELADESVRAVYATHTTRHGDGAASARALRKRRELVQATKLTINERLESLPSLGDLARFVACSPFHLSRIFRQTEGVSLRRYTRRLRARVAADRLAVGQRDLTDLALDLGFADHSHFTNAFRQEWGVPPSRFRALVGPR
jgi:AraC-like DNA-binding protein